MAIRAVIFDFFGTLTFSTPAAVWHEHAARSAAPLGIPAARWNQAFYESWPERATGKLGDLPAMVRTLALRCGADPGARALADACAARLACQRELIGNLRHDAVPTLQSLRAGGIPVVVLSDCGVELAETWSSLPIAGLVTGRVLSCEEGRRKPDPELFRTAARRLNVPPGECLYVGDGGGGELSGQGSSAGGIPVGGALVRRPDLWGRDRPAGAGRQPHAHGIRRERPGQRARARQRQHRVRPARPADNRLLSAGA